MTDTQKPITRFSALGFLKRDATRGPSLPGRRDDREQAEHKRCQAAQTHPADEDRLATGDRRPTQGDRPIGTKGDGSSLGPRGCPALS